MDLIISLVKMTVKLMKTFFVCYIKCFYCNKLVYGLKHLFV